MSPLPKWVEEKRMGHSIVRNSEWDALMIEALSVAWKALEHVDVPCSICGSGRIAVEAMRRIEKLGVDGGKA